MVHDLVTALVFVAGALLGIRLLAALYAPIDLWYTIRIAWPVAVRRVLFWSGLTAAALLVLKGGGRWALVAGLGAGVLLHVGTWVAVSRVFPRRPRPTPVME